MKKITSLLLAFTLLLSLSLSFTSCFHECEFSTEWSKDEASHFHVCIKRKGCTEISDKAEHLWNDGEITTKPTQETDGVKTFTCTVCSATKTEAIDKCVLSTEWLSDESSHWRTCINENCPEIYEKADHVWDEGEITTKPTQEADGVKTYTCTVCSAAKTETVPFTGLSRSEWNNAFSETVLENFAYSEVATVSGSGISISVEEHYKFTADDAWVKIVIADQSEETYAPDKASAEGARKSLIDSIKAATPYACFEYDAESKTYKATERIYMEAYEAYTSDITLTFDGDKLVEMSYTLSYADEGIVFTVHSVVTISDYGTVVLTPSNGTTSTI